MHLGVKEQEAQKGTWENSKKNAHCYIDGADASQKNASWMKDITCRYELGMASGIWEHYVAGNIQDLLVYIKNWTFEKVKFSKVSGGMGEVPRLI